MEVRASKTRLAKNSYVEQCGEQQAELQTGRGNNDTT